MGLRNNISKTIGMVCFSCQEVENELEAAYGQWMTGEGLTYLDRQKGRVQCRDCREDMTVGYLAVHRITQHGLSTEERRIWKTSATGEEPQTYHMAFPAKGGPRSCPVEKCPGRAEMRTAMWVHFLYRHILYIVVILEEGNLPHPRCPQCNMIVSCCTLNGRHNDTTQ